MCPGISNALASVSVTNKIHGHFDAGATPHALGQSIVLNGRRDGRRAPGLASGLGPGVARLPGCTAELVGAHTCQWAVEPVYTSRA